MDPIIDNKNGYLVEQFNTKKLANKLLKLMNSTELRNKFGEESKRRNN